MRAKVICIDEARKRQTLENGPVTSPARIQREFDELYAALAARFTPLTTEKDHWIREAVSAMIMRTKLTELESSLLNAKVCALDTQDDGQNLTPVQRMAAAWAAEAQDGSLEKIYRQMEQADNLHYRAINKLMRIRKTVA